MKMTFACPNCKTHKKIKGRPGEKKVLICDRCGTKGRVSFPEKKKVFGLTKKQLIATPIVATILLLLVFFIVVPTNNGSMHFLTVRSGSMEPSIHVGDVVVSLKVDVEDIEVGDVITFRYPGESDPNKCYTHRVSKIINTEDGNLLFQTKGDMNEDPDTKLVRPSYIIGKASVVVPYLGYFGDFARSIVGYFIFLFVPCILIILFEVRRIFKNKKEKNIRV
jgi:signal peptidase